MKTDMETYARENGLDMVRTDMCACAIIGFENFEEAEKCANALGGEIRLISKRDGHDRWKEHDRAYGPIEINGLWFGENDVAIRDKTASQWWEEEYKDIKETLLDNIDETPSPDELIRIIQTFQTYSKLYDMIENLGENEQIYYENGYPENAAVVPVHTMDYHDFDVHRYAIAVTRHS